MEFLFFCHVFTFPEFRLLPVNICSTENLVSNSKAEMERKKNQSIKKELERRGFWEAFTSHCAFLQRWTRLTYKRIYLPATKRKQELWQIGKCQPGGGIIKNTFACINARFVKGVACPQETLRNLWREERHFFVSFIRWLSRVTTEITRRENSSGKRIWVEKKGSKFRQ